MKTVSESKMRVLTQAETAAVNGGVKLGGTVATAIVIISLKCAVALARRARLLGS